MSAPLGFLRRPSAPASASVAASTASPPSLAALPATGVAIAVAMVRPRALEHLGADTPARAAFWSATLHDEALAAWLAPLRPTRLRVGSEFCERLLPEPAQLARTLAEALQTSPGVFLANSTAPQGSNVSLFTRGTESNHTSVLLDGRRLNPGMDGSSEIARYSLSGLDSVQFSRGATSTLYGANALGGVVDMRTVNTLALVQPTGYAEAEAGSFSSARAAVSVAGAGALSDKEGARRDVGASVSGNLGYTDGTRDNEDFRGNNALGRVEYSPVKAVVFETLAQIHDRDYGVSTSAGAATPEHRMRASGWLVSPGVRFDNDDDLAGHVFYSRAESTLFDTNPTAWGPNVSNLGTDMDEVSVQVDYKPARWVVFSSGYSYERTAFDRTSTYGNNAIAWESHAVRSGAKPSAAKAASHRA